MQFPIFRAAFVAAALIVVGVTPANAALHAVTGTASPGLEDSQGRIWVSFWTSDVSISENIGQYGEKPYIVNSDIFINIYFDNIVTGGIYTDTLQDIFYTVYDRYIDDDGNLIDYSYGDVATHGYQNKENFSNVYRMLHIGNLNSFWTESHDDPPGEAGGINVYGVQEQWIDFGFYLYNVSKPVQFIAYVGDLRELPGGIPEPASWAMLVAGFGLIGGMVRRQRKVAVVQG